jgi:hypothetical protein
LGKGGFSQLFPLFGTRPHEIQYSFFYAAQNYFLFNLTIGALTALISKFYPTFEMTDRQEGSDAAPTKKFDPLNPDTWNVKLWEQITDLTGLDPKFIVQYEEEVLTEKWAFPEECWRKAHDLVGSFTIPTLDDAGKKIQQTYHIVYQGVVDDGSDEQCTLEPKFATSSNTADAFLYNLLDVLDKCWKALDPGRNVSFMKKKDYPVSPMAREVQSYYTERFKLEAMNRTLLQQTGVVPPYLPYFVNVDKYVDVTDEWRLRITDYRDSDVVKDTYGNPDFDATSLVLDMFESSSSYVVRKSHVTADDIEVYAAYRDLGISFPDLMKYAFLLAIFYYGGTSMMSKELPQEYGNVWQLQVVTKKDEQGIVYEEECSETVLSLIDETFVDDALQGCWNKNEINHFVLGKQPKSDFVVTNTSYTQLIDSTGVIQKDDADYSVINDLWPVVMIELLAFKRENFTSIVEKKFNPIIKQNKEEIDAGAQPKNDTGLDSGSWSSADPEKISRYKTWLSDTVEWFKKAGKDGGSNYEKTLKEVTEHLSNPPASIEESKPPKTEAKPPTSTPPPDKLPENKEKEKKPPGDSQPPAGSDSPPAPPSTEEKAKKLTEDTD